MGTHRTRALPPPTQMLRTTGHDWAVRLLRAAVAEGRVAHAYLVTGPDGVGKRHLARYLSAMLQCASDAPPCGVCGACLRIAQDVHPDVNVVAPNEGHIKIDQVRAVQHELSLSPYEGRRRIAVFLDFDTATPEAANALLKTLEEPPARDVLILTATDPSLLLPTVVSRCQNLPLRSVPREEIAHCLAERNLASPERAELLARLSAGRIGWAIRAAENPGLLEERDADLVLLQEALSERRAGRLRLAEQQAQDDKRLPALLRLWQTWWRDLLLICGGSEGLVTNTDRLGALREYAAQCDLQAAGAALRSVNTALQQLEQNAPPRLVLEVMFLGWPTLRAAQV